MYPFVIVPNKPLAKPRHCFRTIKEQMADAIVEIGGAGEPITEEALVQRNFSKAVIARFGEDARQIARRRWNKQVA